MAGAGVMGTLAVAPGCGARTGMISDGAPREPSHGVADDASPATSSDDAAPGDDSPSTDSDFVGKFDLGDSPAGDGQITQDNGDASSSCGVAGSYATQQSLDLFGQIVYFEGGAALPAGHYRVQYVDGCMKYSAAQDWAVNAYADGSDSFWLVGNTSSDRILIPPGTVGFLVGSGGFATFDECVAANQALPPKEFQFAGGKIGVWLSDSPYSDNVAGVDGRNPKWSLTLLEGDCTPVR
jgi:hypothetical protein